MRFLLSALASLSIIGGASSTFLIKNNSSLSNNIQNNIGVLGQDRIDFNGTAQISVTEEQKSLAIDFTTNLSKITQIRFEGGLDSNVQWGSDRFNNHWDNLVNVPIGQDITILRDSHTDGLASLRIVIIAKLEKTGMSGSAYKYRLTMTYTVKTLSSFSRGSGTLTIGNALILND